MNNNDENNSDEIDDNAFDGLFLDDVLDDDLVETYLPFKEQRKYVKQVSFKNAFLSPLKLKKAMEIISRDFSYLLTLNVENNRIGESELLFILNTLEQEKKTNCNFSYFGELLIGRNQLKNGGSEELSLHFSTGLSALQSLDISYNKITNLEMFTKNLYHLKGLVMLNLSGNSFLTTTTSTTTLTTSTTSTTSTPSTYTILTRLGCLKTLKVLELNDCALSEKIYLYQLLDSLIENNLGLEQLSYKKNGLYLRTEEEKHIFFNKLNAMISLKKLDMEGNSIWSEDTDSKFFLYLKYHFNLKDLNFNSGLVLYKGCRSGSAKEKDQKRIDTKIAYLLLILTRGNRIPKELMFYILNQLPFFSFRHFLAWINNS